MGVQDETVPMRPGDRPGGSGALTKDRGAPAGEALLAKGTAIGRYLVLEPLGEGGMGVVYACYDPELDRRVAVKVLRVGEGSGEPSGGGARLLREAQALARLTHPNVTAVHDVGHVEGGGVFVAMELVDGWTLRAWQRQPGRTTADKLGAYLAAGRGLAAAHAAGLVHRDFKPDNVLVGRDQRVRVTDFGLVRAAHPEEQPRPPLPVPAYTGALSQTPGHSPLSGELTHAGAVLGTPHYMAPEQHRGWTADERSDQFSFCVALWEALFDRRPYGGETMVDLAEAMEAARREPPPPGHQVPVRVVRALDKGLARDPVDRWERMDQLLAELEAATRPRRRARVAALALVVAAGAGGALALGASEAGKPAPCAGAAAPAEELWSAARRAEAEAAFAASGAPFAGDSWTATAARLDAWTAAWSTMAVESCKATRVQHTQSDSLGDRRAACLGRRLDEAAVLVARLTTADAALVERAVDLVAELPDLEVCADVVALDGRAPPPVDPEARRRIDELDGQVAGLRGRLKMGGEDLRAPASLLVEQAKGTGFAPLIAAAWIVAGDALAARHEGKAARAAYLAGAAAAVAGGDDERFAGALLALVGVTTDELDAYDEADEHLTLAAAAVGRLERPGAKLGELHGLRGHLLRQRGQLAEARKELEVALAARERREGPDSPGAVDELIELSLCARDQGQIDDARAYLARAEKIADRVYGEGHPRSATILHDHAVLYVDEGKYAEARPIAARALAIREAAFGARDYRVGETLQLLGVIDNMLGDTTKALAALERALVITEEVRGGEHRDVASVLNDLGGVHHKRGEYEQALAVNQRAHAIKVKVLGPDHPEVGYALVNMAIEEKALGRYEHVEARYRAALAIFHAKLGDEHFATAIGHINLGEVLRVMGRHGEALVEYGRAEAIVKPKFGESHPIMGHVRNGVGQAELARGRLGPALVALEAALAIREADPGDVQALSETRFALARALVAARQDRARAVELAGKARAGYAGLGAAFVDEVAAVDAWLARESRRK